MSSVNARAGEREWKPKMKNRGRKAPASASVSSQAADRAMANIKDINRRRDRGEDVDAVFLAKVSRSLEAPVKGSDLAAKASQPLGKMSRSAMLAGAVGLAAILLVIGGVFLAGALLTILYLMRAFAMIFLGDARGDARIEAREASATMVTSVAILAALSLAGGIFIAYPSGFAHAAVKQMLGI